MMYIYLSIYLSIYIYIYLDICIDVYIYVGEQQKRAENATGARGDCSEQPEELEFDRFSFTRIPTLLGLTHKKYRDMHAFPPPTLLCVRHHTMFSNGITRTSG